MVKNNGIPFEVKKPVETVYELKDYEVKTSKLSPVARAKVIQKHGVNYQNWQATKDIWMPHVYGPGEEWDDLCIQCPAQHCPDKHPKRWVHRREDCRNPVSYMEWSTHAKLRCSYCKSPSHISNWLFRCHRHTEPATYGHTQFTVAITMAFKARKVNENFADELLDFLRDNPY